MANHWQQIKVINIDKKKQYSHTTIDNKCDQLKNTMHVQQSLANDQQHIQNMRSLENNIHKQQSMAND